VATEAALPILVANVVGIGTPVGFQFREEILIVDFLHLGDEAFDLGRFVAGGVEGGVDFGHGFAGVGIILDEDSHGVGLDPGHGAHPGNDLALLIGGDVFDFVRLGGVFRATSSGL